MIYNNFLTNLCINLFTNGIYYGIMYKKYEIFGFYSKKGMSVMAAKIITIARQYGSGGRAIGKLIAEKCGFDFYDNNLIAMSAKKIGMDEGRLTEADEKIPNSLLYTLAVGSANYGGVMTTGFQPINDKLFIAQSEIVTDIAKSDKGAVIVGRCADHVLEDFDNVTRIYLYADFDKRVAEIVKRHGLSESEAKNRVMKTDKRRATYYNYYTGKKWGKLENYDIALATDNLTIEEVADLIIKLAKI